MVGMCILLMTSTHTQGNTEDETQQSQTQPPSGENKGEEKGEDKGEEKGEDNTNEVLWADFTQKRRILQSGHFFHTLELCKGVWKPNDIVRTKKAQ